MKRKLVLMLCCVVMMSASPVYAADMISGFASNFAQGFMPLGTSLGELAANLVYNWAESTAYEIFPNVKALRLAAKEGDREAQYQLGVMYENGKGTGIKKDYYEAAQMYQASAEQGYAKAQNALGNLYRKGRGVLKDRVKALYWISLAAEQGYVEAQANLGKMHYDSKDLDGKVSSDDIAEAFKWLSLAAEQELDESLPAKIQLGLMYYKG